MSASAYWQSLVSAALLGTERQAPPSPEGTPFAPLARQTSPEERLLDALAAASLYRRGGAVLPQSPHPPLEAAAPDVWGFTSEAQHELLQTCLESPEHRPLLAEVLALMAQARVAPYSGWLFKLLEAGRDTPLLRPLLLEVLGPRGHWLARWLPQGEWVTPSEPGEALWEEGRLEERMAYLRLLRGRDPGRARALVEAVWAQESHEVRVRLLEALQDGLSPADEPFLEGCLDDRRKEVRAAAQGLLAGLPESRLVRRMVARAEPLLAFRPAGLLGLKKAELEVRLPEAYDKTWARDGIEQKGMPYGMGQRAWWLQQMLERVPPALWNKFGAKPAELMWAVGKEWEQPLRAGLYAATLRFRDLEWARALLALHDDYTAQPLIALLPPEEVEAQALLRLKSGAKPLRDEGSDWQFVLACPQPLSAEVGAALGRRALHSLEAWQALKGADWRLRQLLPALALVLPPGFAAQIPPAVREALAKPEHPLSDAFARFEELLAFRARVREAFGEPR